MSTWSDMPDLLSLVCYIQTLLNILSQAPHTINNLCKALELCGSSLFRSCTKILFHSIRPCMCIVLKRSCVYMSYCFQESFSLSPPYHPSSSSPCWITALLSPPQLSHCPCLWLSDSVGPGYSPVVRPALNAGLLPPNYQLQGPASTPGAGQAGNELSPLG